MRITEVLTKIFLLFLIFGGQDGVLGIVDGLSGCSFNDYQAREKESRLYIGDVCLVLDGILVCWA